MGRRDHPGIGTLGLLGTQRLELAILDYAQQLGLEIGRSVTDFIEEDRPPPGEGEPPFAGVDRAGEGAAGVAEEFRFEQSRWQGGTVDWNERLGDGG